MVSRLQRNQAKNIYRNLEIYDILHKQPEVAEKQIQVGGRFNIKVYTPVKRRMIKMSFSENLQAIRKKNQLSQEALAELLGVSRQAVSKWELGDSFS